MTRYGVRVGVVVALLGTVIGGLATASAGAPGPVGKPGGLPNGQGHPNGPWPPRSVLAADPGEVAAPQASAAAVSNPNCPSPPSGVQSVAPGSGKTVALTFDDGPGKTTFQILNILQQNGVAATFFNIGVNQTARPAEVRAEAALEYPLGNHTWTHPQMPTLSASDQGKEMDQTSAEQASLVGSAPCLFRPPYGEYNDDTLAQARQRRMSVWNWSVDTEDWKAGTSTDQSWVERIVTRAEAGGSQQHPVILMHNPPAGIPATVAALPRIIAYYKANGYSFVDLYGHTGQHAAPAAATTGHRNVVVRNPDGSVWRRTGTGSTWSSWTALGGTIVAAPTAVASGGTLAVFGTGSNNQVYEKTVADSGAASGWVSLGGTVTSKPGAAVGPGGRISLVARGNDGAAYLKENVGGSWSGWTSLGGGLASAPTIAATSDGGLTVGVLGLDDALWIKHRTGSAWGSWRRIGGTITAEPALSATAGGSRIVATVRGAAGVTYTAVSDAAANSWGGWVSLGGTLVSGPAVTVDGSTLAVYGYGSDGKIYRKVASNGAGATGWSGWAALPA
jgi:peptidoglycan/xylan/chitin deacetylase (PgdA/CDA1 family)